MSVIGTCLCGAVRYEIDGPFVMMLHCHCSMCRKHHGAAFATFVAAPLAGLRWLAGEEEIVHYASSAQGVRSFCPHCGSVAPTIMEAMDQVVVPAGNLQGELGIEPQGHIFAGSKAPWYEITDALPQYEAYPPEFDGGVVERTSRPTRPGLVSGSCLCGDVAYTVNSKPTHMFYCHCSRCRRSRGAAHAANVFYGIDGFEWTAGSERVREFKPPDALRFTSAFCDRCGGIVPRVSRERGMVIVPAGSLDTDPGMRVMARIYVADKAPWVSITDTLPQFAQAPS